MSVSLHAVLLYSAYVIGFIGLLLATNELGFNYRNIKERFRVSQTIAAKNINLKWMDNQFLKKYNFLLSSAFQGYKFYMFPRLIIMQITAFVGFFILNLFLLNDWKIALFTAFFFSVGFPVGFAFFRHKRNQNHLQNNIINATIYLLKAYNRSNSNMLYALKDVADDLDGTVGIVFAKLFARMHDTDDMKELAAEAFAFQLGKYFRAKNLASNILKACKEGIEVEVLLEDLITDMTEMRKRSRSAESDAKETSYLGYLPLPLIAIFIYLNQTKLIPGGKALEYHFGTTLGRQVFILSVIFGIVNLALALLVKRPNQNG